MQAGTTTATATTTTTTTTTTTKHPFIHTYIQTYIQSYMHATTPPGCTSRMTSHRAMKHVALPATSFSSAGGDGRRRWQGAWGDGRAGQPGGRMERHSREVWGPWQQYQPCQRGHRSHTTHTPRPMPPTWVYKGTVSGLVVLLQAAAGRGKAWRQQPPGPAHRQSLPHDRDAAPPPHNTATRASPDGLEPQQRHAPLPHPLDLPSLLGSDVDLGRRGWWWQRRTGRGRARQREVVAAPGSGRGRDGSGRRDVAPC